MVGTRIATHRIAVALSLASILVSAVAAPASAAVTLVEVASGFNRPLYVTNAGDSKLYVVEQGGLIWVVDGGTKSVFADVSGRLALGGNEQGLLGLAFHPSYATNRLFYVHFTRESDGAIVVGEMRRSAGNPKLADPGYFRRVLLIPRPADATNHNGGWIDFRKNLLYVSTGDGGSTPGNGQNLDSLLGKILRINPLDPDGAGSRRYGIPSGNPFVGEPGRNEIWAYGLRNPWRCSFDRIADRLWCADVGQANWEEINRARATTGGLNYGWAVMEGRHCYNAESCNTSGKKWPIAEYSSFGGGNCSITGGYVSRRSGAALYGNYIAGDFCSGNIWTIPAGHTSGAALPTPADTDKMITSFGEGFDRKIYLVHRGTSGVPNSGAVYYVDGT